MNTNYMCHHTETHLKNRNAMNAKMLVQMMELPAKSAATYASNTELSSERAAEPQPETRVDARRLLE